MPAPRKPKATPPANAAADSWEKLSGIPLTSKATTKSQPAKPKQLNPSQRKQKQNDRKQARLLFQLGAAALAVLVLLVLYVTFFVEKQKVPWPAGHSVYGVDVSKYQRDINWEQVRGSEVSFAFLKATEGATLVDPSFDKNWEEARRAGILCGAYHFYRPHVKPDVQARNFIKRVVLQPGDLPPVLDIEVEGRITKAQLRADLKVWLRQVEKAYGVKPIIYTNYSFYLDYLAGHFDAYHLWIARYNAPELQLEKTDKLKLAFWQHTDGGTIDGITGAVDCNVFFGSMRELRSFCIKEPL